ncbi:sigma-70 family RNA polymerase sigma factor [Isoptericola halotolerans]|uniref:sigma-70 family RNA polymerase sigma factor n=1 Tax=Isoptericola halotolerans TaxID=300560 RepID=UPI00388F4BC7
MTDVYVGSDGTAPSDGELILEVRGGSLDAYGALYERHAAAAQLLARQYVNMASDADDVVAEAFHRVLGVLQQGDGPDTHFRAYLFTVVRRLAADLSRRARRTRPTADDGTFESALGPSASPEDPALAGFENSVVARAYERLPERWQAVLWYTEVEQLTPAQVAPILGLTPNGVSALAYRAREGLRVGYLQQHLTAEPADSCRAVSSLLGSYVRGSLSRREFVQVDGHLDGCGDCRALVLELADVAHGMRAVVAPLVVGLAGMAVLGALPLGALTGSALGVAAGSASGAAASGAAASGAAASGAVGSAAGGVGTAAGSGLSAGAGAGAGAAATGTATAGTAAGTGAASAAAGAAATTTATATTAVAATTAGVSGATVAASAGAVAVATVGVVSVLGAMSGEEPAAVPQEPPYSVAGDPWPTEEEKDPVFPEPSDDPQDPFDQVIDPADIPEPPEIGVAVAEPGPDLRPRVTEQLTLQVDNPGEVEATGAHVHLTLPAGVRSVSPASPAGAAAAAAPTAESLPCTPAEGSQEVVCVLGTLEPGESRTVAVPLVAHAGGVYTVAAQTWADGVEPRSIELDPVRVEYFGPELTARTGGEVAVANPGFAAVPFSIENTGDRPADAWTAEVRVPAGLVPRAVDGDLDCEARDEGSPGAATAVWLCSGDGLAPGASATGRATVVADGDTAEGSYELRVVPALPDGGPGLRSVAVVTAPRAWQGANAGAVDTQATCRATGGLDEADAAVVGTYKNRTGLPVSVAFEAAGTSVAADGVLAPGESTTLTARDGLRVPSGGGTWTLSTVVDGLTYSRTVDAGTHGAAECYDPSWDVRTTSQVLNDGGKVRVEGTITNRTDEPMQAAMTAAGGRTEAVRLGAGETATLGRTTDRTELSAGTATFELYRWVTDADGDQPVSGVVPARPPTADHAAATIAPRAADAAAAEACTYDPGSETSWRTFAVPVDNTASTLPVVFVARAGDSAEELRVPAGEKATIELRVAWGVATGTVSADGAHLRDLDVGFTSCAESPSWPSTVQVSATAQCDGGSAQVVVDVAGDDGRAWTATLVRHGETVGTQRLDAGGAVRFVVDAGSWSVPAGEVTVLLARTVEDQTFTVERTAAHDAVRCVVRDPQARLDQGAVQMDRYGDYATSWREVGIVLDNTGSTVRSWFRVVGPHGGEEQVRVPAGETRTVDPRRVDGRQGGTWTVSSGDWSTRLEAETFTATEAGWCAARVSWGEQYVEGDVRSWNGKAYRYLGWDGSRPGGERGNSDGRGKSGDQGRHWYDDEKWRGVWMGQWRQWDEIGLCEYR